ncbi:TPA: fimbria/pilus outer membrane usher protein [Escherichia coli]|nr:fimbrial biogenesis outer membrane usher protein [Escherichia coli]HBN0153925.1 fimbria/pilus outer membrane usher protein [Escherichia coli]HBN0341822.1 fimbria/pilus outer membrane usher protein [Escherichia coli]HCP2027034.1 fimbria/pilus outer membrane usher protein [Escherichia coli]
MTAIRAAFKAYRMHQVLIMPRFARLTIALGLATAVFPVDAEYYFNPRFLSNDLAESVDLSAFTKGREAPPGTYRVDIYLNDEFMTSRDITFIADDNNAELIPCLSTDLLVSLGIKKSALLDNKEHSAEKHVPDNSACTPLQDRLADASTDLGLFGAFSFDITQANTTLADGTRHSGQSVKSVYSKSFYQTGTNIQVAGYRYSTQGFYNLSDSAYSRMSGYTVKPPTGDTNEQTQFIDYFNLFYSKRGQEQISISQQLGNYGTTFFSASRQSYWNTSRSDQQISFGLNVPFGDITTSLNYSYSNNIWQNDRDHLLAFTLNVPFSHWMRTDSQSAFRNSNASYSMSNDLKGGMTNLSGVYGTLLPDNNLNYSVQVGNTHGGNTSSGTSGYSSLNYRGAYGNTNVGYSRNGDSSQIYYGMSGGIIAHADGITFGQPLGDTMVLVKAPGADNVKIENQTGIHTDWRGYAILPFATEYRENRVALNANSLADNVELDETVVTVIPTHGAIARATFNAQIGGKVLMTLKYGNKSVPFGAIVTHGENKNGSIVAENGQVYLTGLPQSGKLQVSWGNDKNSNCIVDYKLPEVSPGTLLNQQTAICR